MSEYLTPAEAAAMIPGMTKSALAQRRFMGNGPKFLQPSPRKVLYRRADIIAWIESTERTQTGRAA